MRQLRTWVLQRPYALLVVGLCITAVLEGTFRANLLWPGFTTAYALACIVATYWRNESPLAVTLGLFGSQLLIRIVAAGMGLSWDAPYSMFVLLTVPFALARHGSVTHIALGLLLVLLFPLRIAVYGSYGSAVGASVVLLTPALLGAISRLRDTRQRREREQAMQREREELAREIHDTVAHRLAAIAVQIQAARVTGAPSPHDETLEVIEEQSTRALAEMRAIVGGLRDVEAAAMAPLPGLGDLEALQHTVSLPMSVDLDGSVESLEPSLAATLYRITREAVTNAVRHAREANQIRIRVTAHEDLVELVVTDDGRAAPKRQHRGFGLVGMGERAKQLGGTLEAGPNPAGGWTVRALLPRHGGSR